MLKTCPDCQGRGNRDKLDYCQDCIKEGFHDGYNNCGKCGHNTCETCDGSGVVTFNGKTAITTLDFWDWEDSREEYV